MLPALVPLLAGRSPAALPRIYWIAAGGIVAACAAVVSAWSLARRWLLPPVGCRVDVRPGSVTVTNRRRALILGGESPPRRVRRDWVAAVDCLPGKLVLRCRGPGRSVSIATGRVLGNRDLADRLSDALGLPRAGRSSRGWRIGAAATRRSEPPPDPSD